MTMPAVFLPLFVQIGLTYFLLFWMAKERGNALQRGEVDLFDVALTKETWPVRARQVANCFQNQFELPVLSYVSVALAILTRSADRVFVVMERIFVLSRIGHASIHTTFNQVLLRGREFGVGTVVLLALWVIFAARMLFSNAEGLP
jgi:hypothetical protein